jgi:hypothetical protein
MGRKTVALIDTGAARSLINSDLWHTIKNSSIWESAKQKCPYLKPIKVQLVTATGDKLKTEGAVTLSIDKVGQFDFIITPGLSSELVIGTDFLEHFQADIRYLTMTLSLSKKTFPMTHGPMDVTPNIKHVNTCTLVDMPPLLKGLEKHPVFRDELGHCVVGEPMRILTDSPPLELSHTVFHCLNGRL